MKNKRIPFKTLSICCIVLILLCLNSNVFAQQIVLDPSWDSDGIKEYNTNYYGSGISSIVQQPDGKIICAASGIHVGATNNVYIATRFLLDGSLDSTFGNAGVVQGGFNSNLCVSRKILLQPDGKIIIGGYAGSNPVGLVGVARLNTDGSADTTFNGIGAAVYNILTADELLTDMLLQPDGKIIIGGYSTSGNGYSGAFLIRIMPDASLDTTFNGTGIVSNPNFLTAADQTTSIALQPDGKIITLGGTLVGSINRNVVRRFNADGTVDATFGSSGTMVSPIGVLDDTPGVIGLQPDGKIIVASYTTIPIPGSNFKQSDYSIARYSINGSIDSTFGYAGRLIRPVGNYIDVPTAIRIDNSGNIFIGGYTNMATPCIFCSDIDMTLIKLDANGIPDWNFGNAGKKIVNWGVQDNTAWDMIIQQDGKFLLAGSSSLPGSGNQMALLRLMPVTPTGIYTNTDNMLSTIYPNPFQHQLTVNTKSQTENMRLSVSDISGKQMLLKNFTGNYIFDTSTWSNGLYFYQLIDGKNKTASGKLIKAD